MLERIIYFVCLLILIKGFVFLNEYESQKTRKLLYKQHKEVLILLSEKQKTKVEILRSFKKSKKNREELNDEG